MHLTFQGYGAPVENFTDLDVGGVTCARRCSRA
jgi:hypothetical protein